MGLLLAAGFLPAGVWAAAAGDSFLVRMQLFAQPELSNGAPPPPMRPPLALTNVRIEKVRAVRGTSTVRLRFQTEPQTIATVQWGLTEAFELGSQTSPIWERSHSVLLEGLAPGRTYFFRIRVQDAFGRTASYRGKFATLREGEVASLPLPAPKRFRASYDAVSRGVRLRWQPTDDVRARAVRIVRSPSFFPADPWDGEIVYEGRDTQTIDQNVRPGTTYFYSAFTYGMEQDGTPIFSSGVAAWVKIPVPGEEEGETRTETTLPQERPEEREGARTETPFVKPQEAGGVETILERLPPARGKDAQQARRLRVQDLTFLQGGIVRTPSAGGVVPVDASQPVRVLLPKDKTPSSLKTIVMVVRESEAPDARSYTALLRLSRDRTTYEALLPPFGRAGFYPFTLYLLSYRYQRLTRIEGVFSAASAASAYAAAPLLRDWGMRWDAAFAGGVLLFASGAGLVFAGWLGEPLAQWFAGKARRLRRDDATTAAV